MIWCPTCRRPHGHNKWTCSCGLIWHNCVKHRPIELQNTAESSSANRVHNSKAVSASTSAAKLNQLESHSSSRVILSPGLAQRFPHLVGAPIGTNSILPSTASTVQSTRVCNNTIHTEHANDELPANARDNDDKRPAVVRAAPTPQLPKLSSVTPGESSHKKRSRPCRRVGQ